MTTEINQDAAGVEINQDAAGVETPAVGKSINAAAKDLPWVQELIKSKSELDRLRQAQADAQSQAEREKAEAEGRYTEALEMEKRRNEELSTKYQTEVRRLKLEKEFAQAGIRDLRAVALFESDYNPESESAAEFVARTKAEEGNQLYFDSKQRAPQSPPAPAGGGSPDNFDPDRDLDKWLKSTDPDKRKRAVAYKRESYWKGRAK